MKDNIPVKATLSAIIIRACTVCGDSRTVDIPCESCGNPDPPVTHDLGTQSVYYKNPWKRLAWRVMGQYLANYRARRVNKEVCG